MAIHASVAKRASEHGLVLVEAEGRVEARRGQQVVAYNGKASTALKHALDNLEAERIRNLADNQEPVLLHRAVSAQPDPAVPQKVIKGSIIKSKYRDRYKKNGDFSCGDDIAGELKAYVVVARDGKFRVDLVRLREVAIANEVWKDRYAALNPGQQRMTIGNCLRAKFREGKRIDIGGAVLEQVIDV